MTHYQQIMHIGSMGLMGSSDHLMTLVIIDVFIPLNLRVCGACGARFYFRQGIYGKQPEIGSMGLLVACGHTH